MSGKEIVEVLLAISFNGNQILEKLRRVRDNVRARLDSIIEFFEENKLFSPWSNI